MSLEANSDQIGAAKMNFTSIKRRKIHEDVAEQIENQILSYQEFLQMEKDWYRSIRMNICKRASLQRV